MTLLRDITVTIEIDTNKSTKKERLMLGGADDCETVEEFTDRVRTAIAKLTEAMLS